MSLRLNEQYEYVFIYLWDLLEGKEKFVCGIIYKVLKEIVECVFQLNYFDSIYNYQNGLCEEEEVVLVFVVEDQVFEVEFELVEEYIE